MAGDLSPADLRQVDDLVSELNAMSKISVSEERSLRANFRPEDAAMPIGLNDRSGREIDDDLAAQVRIMREVVATYRRTGLVPAPYYAWRVAVILSKGKELEREKVFLKAWCRHFRRMKGTRFTALNERALKRGAIR